MTEREYREIEAHMRAAMPAGDDCHGAEHVLRVLNNALDIAQHEDGVDCDILIAAALLHDIGRPLQDANPAVSHARAGSELAYDYLLARGWPEERAAHVRDCVRTHSFRAGDPPATLEAKILFDADKLDVCGAIGVARKLQYGGTHDEPVYTRDESGAIRDGTGDEPDSFFHEYHHKLKKVYDGFFTRHAAALARGRRRIMEEFCAALLEETRNAEVGAQSLLAARLTRDSSLHPRHASVNHGLQEKI